MKGFMKNKSIGFIFIFFPLLAGMGVDLYTPSLPSITHNLQTSSYLVQWTISLYLVGYAMGTFILGLISDRYGRKSIMLGCGLLFAFLSAAASFSQDILTLIILRCLQGFCVSGLLSMSRAIAIDVYSGLELKRAITQTSIFWAVGPVVGPYIGGLIETHLGWRYDFVFFSIYCLILTIFYWIFVPESMDKSNNASFRVVKNNVVSILSSSFFWVAALSASTVYSTIILFNVVGPFIIVDHFRKDALFYSHCALVLGISLLAGNILSKLLIGRADSKIIIINGVLAYGIISLITVYVQYTYGHSMYSLLTPIILITFLCGMLYPTLVSSGLAVFPKAGGTSNSIWGLVMISGVSLSTFVTSGLSIDNTIDLSLNYLILSLLAFTFSLSLYKSFRKMEISNRCSS